jgi:hypothetical protein
MTRGGCDRGPSRGRDHDHERHDGVGETYRGSLLIRNEIHASNRVYRNVTFI